MRIRFRHLLLGATGVLLSCHVLAANVGWRPASLPGAPGETAPVSVVLYYPTQTPAQAIPMGPFTVRAAIRAAPEARVKGLIVLSHGTGGSELGHTSLAEALAQAGYLVAALRHPGDNWQDRSLLTQGAARYFTERPRQASRVIDALLGDPEWKDRIASDAQGPRVGALGHSAGGYTVLALAGGRPDLPRLAAHCSNERAQDPIFCSVGNRPPAGAPQPQADAVPAVADPRVRAVVAMAPVGAVFSAESLAAVRVPTAVYGAAQDRYLVPQFHADWIARHLAGAEVQRVPGAGHFAFMDTPSQSIQTEDGDARADPPGFDRAALLQRLAREIPAFFDRSWR